MNKTVLYYIYDPMCSWCWGYRPAWSALQKQLKTKLDIQYRVGGLASDSDLPMPDEMQLFLQQTWQKISRELGTKFNFDFWNCCLPRRSTYPACRALLAAREQGLEQEFCFAVQQAYYLQAKNPSDEDTLLQLAASLGFNREQFKLRLNSETLNQQLMNEIATVRQMPIQGFPSLVLAVNGQFIAVPVDYKNWQNSYKKILSYL